MKDAYFNLGISPVKALIPNKSIPLSTWCTIACDQYTSDCGYWAQVDAAVGENPSTLRMILPECYLECPSKNDRIAAIGTAMEDYLTKGILNELPEGFILLKRTFKEGHSRNGLILALDLERYSYAPGAKTLIRCTEGTIESRIPPRLAIRKDAPLELPHILVLINDAGHTVIEPLFEQAANRTPIYEGELSYDMGSIVGYHIPLCESGELLKAFTALYDAGGEDPMLFAMGDGNHSFATAKAHWEMVKKDLTPEEQRSHPARFAMCEVVNLHNEGLLSESIHRFLFTPHKDAADFIFDHMTYMGATISVCGPNTPGALGYQMDGIAGYVKVTLDDDRLLLSLLDDAIAAYISVHDGTWVDYIHGEKETRALSQRGVGFILPPFDKSSLFPYVMKNGPLPRKTFSLGEANDKRCYLEARRIK
ncbi:MAG: DUF1015 domain-containing protein [Clostridiales bacterium]|nr:DUF1015 domain-containing protein [Clostridiales bacterium]